MRESLADLLKALGFAVQAFIPAEEFLASDLSKTRCLMIVITLLNMSGLQKVLIDRKLKIPIVFTTARRDNGNRFALLAGGAVECLFRPFSEGAVIAAVGAALRAK